MTGEESKSVPGDSRQKRTRTSNGESSIYETNGVWHGWVTMGVKTDGSPDRRHRQGKTRKEVVAKVKVLQKARESGNYAGPGTAGTLEQWLNHWIRNVAPMTLRRKSLASYASDVRCHLVPGLGRHRLDRLTTVQVEALYGTMARETKEVDGLKVPRFRPATIEHVHRTLRSALRDAVDAGLIVNNVAARAKRPKDQSVEGGDHAVEPFDVDAAKAIIAAASIRRNGLRFMVAFSHGVRQGEALGLSWPRIFHDGDGPSMAVDQQLQRHTWLHGCGDERLDANAPEDQWPCGGKRGAGCPERHSGGLVLTQTKSLTGERRLALDPVTANLFRAHRTAQAQERAAAGALWDNPKDLVFTQANGHPIDPRADADEWKELLVEAGVREARLHDARHTAATFLLVQGVAPRVVMDLMGWSSPAMLKRYQHVVDELRRDAALGMGRYLHGESTGSSTS